MNLPLTVKLAKAYERFMSSASNASDLAQCETEAELKRFYIDEWVWRDEAVIRLVERAVNEVFQSVDSRRLLQKAAREAKELGYE